MIPSLVIKSLRNRSMTTALTILSISMSVALLLGIERLKHSAHDSFLQTISNTDLIVGARSGQIPLLLSSIFHIGNPANNIDIASYEEIIEEPVIAWSIPFSMGDGHRGYRVIGTDENFYQHYTYQHDKQITFDKGRQPSSTRDVAIGAVVAQALDYDIGHKIVLEHGITAGETSFHRHDDKPFTVVGILAATGTPIDRAMYISLQGIEDIHEGWEDGAPPLKRESSQVHDSAVQSHTESGHEAHAAHDEPAAHGDHDDHDGGKITTFLLRTKNRIDTLGLQRQINEYIDEPLSAIIPGLALSELWTAIGYGESVLLIISGFVVIIGLIGMLISIYNSLNERRREMAIIRSLGASPIVIVTLLVTEAMFLTVSGIVIGLIMTYGIMAIAQPLISTKFGIYLAIGMPTQTEYIYMAFIFGLGTICGIIPAIKAYRNALVDGLQVRT